MATGRGGRRPSGVGSVYKRQSDGRWVGVLNLGYADGRRTRKVVYGATQREVVQKLDSLRRDVDNGRDLTQAETTVQRFLTDVWLPMKEVDGTRASTLRSYRWLVHTHVVPSLGRKSLGDLTTRDVQIWMNEKRASDLSLATCNHALRLLRNALGDAEDLGLIGRNVARSVKLAKVPQRTVPALDVDSARSLMLALEGHRMQALITTILVLGLRRGEALGLRWADVDFDAGVVHVRQTLQRLDGELRVEATKTGSSSAPLAAPPSLLRLLEAHRRGQLKDQLAFGQGDTSDLVFRSTTGTPLEPRNASREWEKIRAAAGLPDVRLHDLRHSCATILTAQGVHPRVVMEMLRHSQIGVTMNVYSHVSPLLQREAAEVLERALFA